MATVVETRRDRLALTADAGVGRISFVSIVAGVMTAYGTFVLVLAATGAALRLVGVETDYSDSDWGRIGTGAGLVVACVLFVSYLFGGYVAGRMARRAGAAHGFLVFLVGLALALGAVALANAATDSDAILEELRSVGIPTSGDEWREAGTIVGIASLAAMVLGSWMGGLSGERWHGWFLGRALDPSVGTEAALRRRRDDLDDDDIDVRHADAERRVVRASGTSTLSTRDDIRPTHDTDHTTHTGDEGEDDTTVHRRPRRGLLRR